jgi:hypothetical protein
MKPLILRRNVLEVIIPLVCGTSAAMMLEQGFSIHHEVIHDLTLAHRG